VGGISEYFNFLMRPIVDHKFDDDDSLPVASGLSGEWVKTKKAKKAKKGPTEATQCMDDEAALST
jgi:hypothetical protein